MYDNIQLSARQIAAYICFYLWVAIAIYEGTGLLHEPYDHLVSSTDRAYLQRVAGALSEMPSTDYFTTPESVYVPRSNKADLRFALLERGLLNSRDGEPVELVDPQYLHWEGRLRDPAYIQKVKAELEKTIEDYLDGGRVEINIEMETTNGTITVGPDDLCNHLIELLVSNS